MEIEVYEALNRMREHLHNVKEFYRMTHSWLSNEEIAVAKKAIKELTKDAESLVEECLKQNICPDCGGFLEAKHHIDDDCGREGYLLCENCGKKWDE